MRSDTMSVSLRSICDYLLERRRELDRIRPQFRIAVTGHTRQGGGVQRPSRVSGFRIETVELGPRLQVSPDKSDLPVSAATERTNVVGDRCFAQLHVTGVLGVVRVRTEYVIEAADASR